MNNKNSERCTLSAAIHLFILCMLLPVLLGSVPDVPRLSRGPRTLRVRNHKFQNCPLPQIDNGRVIIRSRRRGAIFKCDRRFDLFGEKFSTCLRGHWTSPPPTCVQPGCTPVSRITNGEILQNPQYRFAVQNFTCDPGYSLKGSPVIFCNGETWNSTAPNCEVDYGASAVSCDFETEDVCGWTQERNSEEGVRWFRQTGATPSRVRGTGPLYDHTLGQGNFGNFLYIEASVRSGSNHIARIFSPVYSPELSQDACFTFWYHMYGVSTGSLKVYVKPEGVKIENVKPIFQKNGEQGDVWLEGFFNISKLEVPFQIVIEGVRGESFLSDIAFDDARLHNGTSCNHYSSMTTTEAATRLPTLDYSMPSMPVNTEPFIYNTNTKKVSEIVQDSSSEHAPAFGTTTAALINTKIFSVTAVMRVSQGNLITSLNKETHMTSQLNTDVHELLGESTIHEEAFRPTSWHELPVTTLSPATSDRHMSSQAVGGTNTSQSTPRRPTITTRHATTQATMKDSRTAIRHMTRATTRPTPRATTRPTTRATTRPTTRVTTRPTTCATTRTTVRTPTRLTTPTKTHKIPQAVTSYRPTVKWTTPTAKVRTSSSGSRPFTTLMTTGSTNIKDFLVPRVSSNMRSEKSILPLAVAGTVVAILLCICGAVLAFIVVRRRFRRRHRDDLSDDSDVRFLTADEILDFTLATPKEFRDDNV